VDPCLVQIGRCLFLTRLFSAVDLEVETWAEADKISRLSTSRSLLFAIKQCRNQSPQILSSQSSQFSSARMRGGPLPYTPSPKSSDDGADLAAQVSASPGPHTTHPLSAQVANRKPG
jgi:hypothetical protein